MKNMSVDCDCCAVFAHSYDGKMFAAIKCIGEDMDLDEEETPVKFLGVDEDYLEFFQELDGEIGFHCYGLIIETKKESGKSSKISFVGAKQDDLEKY